MQQTSYVYFVSECAEGRYAQTARVGAQQAIGDQALRLLEREAQRQGQACYADDEVAVMVYAALYVE